MTHKLGRWAAPMAAGLLWTVLLALLMLYRLKTAEAGLQVLLVTGFSAAPIREFGVRFILTLLVPFYLAASLALWGAALALASLAKRGYSDTWRARDGFLLTLSALVWVHLILWWQVPTTLWLIPGLRALPFYAGFPLLGLLTLAYPIRWFRREGLGWLRGGLLVAGCLVLWSAAPLLPERLPRLLTPAKGGSDPAAVLIVGLDGLREDVGLRETAAWKGTAYDHAYTVIPATRLLWHILWGGDPLYYTIGHAPPTKEEMMGEKPLPLIDLAHQQGWQPRFYIDDGGTIGLAGRVANFDDVVMPAPGWENFVNSNLSSAFPLFAVWENWGRAFPTTNPWAPLDAGLREALRLGSGAKLVMFHSCLAHVPIFLRRGELAEVKGWWTMRPMNMEPYTARQQLTPERVAKYDVRRDPFLAYSIRMKAILKAWEPIWNGLDQDPRFKGAVRILFSDHGERFYHVTEQVQLAGVHGYNLDPWEAKITLRVDGPGFEAAPGAPAQHATISVLSIRDALEAAIKANGPLERRTLETSHPEAPLRYETLSRDLFTDDSAAPFREMEVDKLITHTAVAANGIWFIEENGTADARAEQVSLGFGRGGLLEIIKPLKAGGAYQYDYEGYTLKAVKQIPEADYTAAKARAVKALTAP